MKNSIYISGIISAIGLTVGALFKIQHWPASGFLLTIFIIFFTLIFLPAALWNNFKKGKKNVFLYICIFITIVICFGAALFKILHWPGAGIMVMVGLIAPFIIFLPTYIFYYNKTTNKDITNFIAILFLLVFVALMDAFLAIGISKNIIDYTVQINQTTNQINTVLEGKNEMMYKNLPSLQPGLLDDRQIVNLKTRTKELCNLIDEMKFSLVIAAGNNNEFYISDSGDIDLWKIKGKDNSSIAAGKFLYTDEARILKNQIEAYKEYVKSLNVKNFTFDLDEILNIDDINKTDQFKAWESELFEGSIMVWALQKLDMIKMKVKMVESEVLTAGFTTGSEV
jgi:hypothetical protein